MLETYAAARVRLHRELGYNGWKVSNAQLKTLWAENGGARLEFKSQAVYLDGHSLFIDIREMKVETLLKEVANRLRYNAIHGI